MHQKEKSLLQGCISSLLVGGTLWLSAFPACAIPAESLAKDMAASVSAVQQKGHEITGTVTDAKTSEPLIGVTVMVKGTTNGVMTDVDGQFRLNCKEGDVLQISYIGYETKEVKVGSLKMYMVEMNESAEMLEEVVVTAFGVGQKKASMVGSVSQVRSEDLRVPSASLSSSFAGRLSGVIAVQRSGEPGADGADFWIRGKSTFSGATGALIVLDGVEISAQEGSS